MTTIYLDAFLVKTNASLAILNNVQAALKIELTLLNAIVL